MSQLIAIEYRRVSLMRREMCILILCALVGTACAQNYSLPKDASWNQKSGTFTWWLGEVTLPGGFTYQRDDSDTFEGHFTSRGGNLIIRHDIGGYAGARAKLERSLSFDEKVVGGVRVWTANRKWPDGKGGHTVLVAVTFPDSGCANCFLESPNGENAATIDSIAKSFRPKGPIQTGSFCR